MPDKPPRIKPPARRQPAFRSLRVYSFDPSFEWQLDTAVINQMTLQVPWEELTPGPVGEYLEVVDVDPASQCCYAPVDLDDRFLLAQDGLAPSEGDPQVHQQMVYAVAMTTIRNFERALGRRVLWAPGPAEEGYPYVRRLRIYPHAMREENAYYKATKKALVFGYFPAPADGVNLPGGPVFTCLSHDVVAHETTHALLDGLHRRFLEDSNVDALAFHEAFADIVALFQHFSQPAALRDQIRRTRGDLASQNVLGQLAQQFGQALGTRGALRDALGRVNENGVWEPHKPDPNELLTTIEAHDRGAILVAAVFDAFLTIYKSRIADLLRIATAGTGVLPQGEIHPDLVDRLAREASATASHILNMCIRALDYCPPVDITFGDYLRALVTADRDLVPDDDRGYRIAMIEAFRRRGIYPQGVRSLSADSLCWAGPAGEEAEEFLKFLPGVRSLRRARPDWSLSTSRRRAWNEMRRSGEAIHGFLLSEGGRTLAAKVGLAVGADAPFSIERSPENGLPKLEVHSVRPARRLGPDGQAITDLVIEVTQKRRGYFDPDTQKQVDETRMDSPPQEDFTFRGGCTVLVDLDHGEVRYSISKGILSASRLEAQRSHAGGSGGSLRATYLADPRHRQENEPLARLHSPYREEQP
jgi:hypothetical protein